jgi:Holliday junction DNA helicase RuvB
MLMLSWFDEMDNKILTTIIDKFKGGPVGLTTLATAVSESETIEEVYDFLIQEGFIMRTLVVKSLIKLTSI